MSDDYDLIEHETGTCEEWCVFCDLERTRPYLRDLRVAMAHAENRILEKDDE
jgi:hypothetical protein